jgi:phage-related protein
MRMLRFVALTNCAPCNKLTKEAVEMWIKKGQAEKMKCFLNALMSTSMSIRQNLLPQRRIVRNICLAMEGQ